MLYPWDPHVVEGGGRISHRSSHRWEGEEPPCAAKAIDSAGGVRDGASTLRGGRDLGSSGQRRHRQRSSSGATVGLREGPGLVGGGRSRRRRDRAEDQAAGAVDHGGSAGRHRASGIEGAVVAAEKK
jgi:hypothetical protein